MEAFDVAEAASSAIEHKQVALRDIIAHATVGDTASLAKTLEAIMTGASPDDAAALRKALLTERNEPQATPPSSPDDELASSWRETSSYPYRNLMSRKAYEKQKYRLQVELLKLQNWMKETGQRVVVIFEGRDAAGKGGAIKRFTEHLNPRGGRVVALDKPSEQERGQWYFQRYVRHLPTAGEIVFCDRSWYNRAGVERVMGFCSEDEYTEFMRQTPEVERTLVRSGIHLIKFWFSVSRKEQRRRFKERQVHPLKQWKLSPIDLASLDKWDDYTKAKGGDVFPYRHRRNAVDGHQVRLQEARAPECHALRPAQAELHRQRRGRHWPHRSSARRSSARGLRTEWICPSARRAHADSVVWPDSISVAKYGAPRAPRFFLRTALQGLTRRPPAGPGGQQRIPAGLRNGQRSLR